MVKSKNGKVTITGEGREIMADIGVAVYAFINEVKSHDEDAGAEAAARLLQVLIDAVGRAVNPEDFADGLEDVIDIVENLMSEKEDE